MVCKSRSAECKVDSKQYMFIPFKIYVLWIFKISGNTYSIMAWNVWGVDGSLTDEVANHKLQFALLFIHHVHSQKVKWQCICINGNGICKPVLYASHSSCSSEQGHLSVAGIISYYILFTHSVSSEYAGVRMLILTCPSLRFSVPGVTVFANTSRKHKQRCNIIRVFTLLRANCSQN